MESNEAKLIKQSIEHSHGDRVYHKTLSENLDIPLLHLVKTVQHADGLRLKDNYVSVRNAE